MKTIVLMEISFGFVFFFPLPHRFSAEGLKWMTVLLGSLQAMKGSPVPVKPRPGRMLRDGRLVGLECDGTDRCGLTEAMGDVGVGGVGHGRGERDRWCLIQTGWSWKFCSHMGRTVIGRGLQLVLCGRPGVMLKLLGVAILVRGANVRNPVVLEVRCLEPGLPRRGVRSRGVGVGPYLGWGLGWMGWRAFRLGCWRSVVAC